MTAFAHHERTISEEAMTGRLGVGMIFFAKAGSGRSISSRLTSGLGCTTVMGDLQASVAFGRVAALNIQAFLRLRLFLQRPQTLFHPGSLG